MRKGYKKYYIKNERIRDPELRVVNSEGENVGVMKTRDALAEARAQDLDLVIITEKASPKVAKILDFNKFLYKENKKASATKAKSKKSGLKEFVFGPRIADADLNMRIRRAIKFIEGGDRVRLTLRLRGRERAFPEVGFGKIDAFTKGVQEVAKPERAAAKIGNMIRITYVRK